jgi:hypothetical protein
VPTTLIAKNLMLACKWGLKTFYYSLINKQGAKLEAAEVAKSYVNGAHDASRMNYAEVEIDDDCEACKL